MNEVGQVGAEGDPVARGEASVAVGWGTCLAAVVAAVVAARLSGEVALPLGWVAAWGPATLGVGLVAAALRTLDDRAGLPPTSTNPTPGTGPQRRGAGGPRATSARALGFALVVAFGPLALFGEVLARATHHRPLGAATFAVLGLAALVLAVAYAARLVAAAQAPGAWGVVARWALRVGLAAGVLLGLFVILRGLVEAGAGPLRTGLVDGALLVLATLVAARLPGWKWSNHPRLGWGLWAAVVVASSSLLAALPAVRAVLAREAPVLLPLGGWLGG